MSSTPSSGRKPVRGGGRGRGKGGGRRGGRGGGGRSSSANANKRSSDSGRTSSTNAATTTNGTDSTGNLLPEMRDEEILIAFMPYLKGNNQEATAIHELYQSNNDQKAFLAAARQLLSIERSGNGGSSSAPRETAQMRSQPTSAAPPIPTPTTSANENPDNTVNVTHSISSNGYNSMNMNGTLPASLFSHSNSGTQQSNPHHNQQGFQKLQEGEASPGMEMLERKMAGLLSDDDDVISMPVTLPSIGGSTIGPSSPAMNPSNSAFESLFPSSNPMQQPGHPHGMPPQMHQQQQPLHQQRQPPPQHNLFQQPPHSSNGFSNTPHNMIMSSAAPGQSSEYSRFSSLFATENTQNNNNSLPSALIQQPGQGAHIQNIPGSAWPASMSNQSIATRSNHPPGLPGHDQFARNLGSPISSISPMQTPTKSSTPAPETPSQLSLAPDATPAKPAKKEYQPKRLWTHLEDQPGKILANNAAATIGTVVDLRPRQELTARWMLPLSYLREHAQGQEVHSIRDLLKNLSVGLFRRGCTENGSQASIVSKEILSESRDDYPFQVTQDSVVGTVPFYSPRTPGHVVFRMYWDDEPLHTLATGPTLNVRVTENDFESSIRFILSNFKSKKVNPTSLSSLNSLSLVLEQFHVHANKPGPGAQHHLQSAGRAVWGCVCEARKVLDACALDYQKTTVRLEKLEESVEELKELVAAEEENPDLEKTEIADDETHKSARSGDAELSVNATLLREKTKMLMSGKASCERKWRDSQLAFASILKAIVLNPSMGLLLRRELITKLRLEYELWCPLCEEFAVPGDNENQMWYEPINRMPQPITTDHFRVCSEARSKMQIRILGFDPNSNRLENILYPSRGRSREMNPGAVSCFNQLSSSMGQLYQEFYFTADIIIQQRERIRQHTEKLVNMCDCFPPGTKVAIFGSSANGFGSPKSDLDMCLQIPSGTSIVNENDPTGAVAMATLAKLFEENGIQDVDTARLTARIPVIKFNCPRGSESDLLPGEELLMECDLSMNNPLAVLNTSLLRTYAEINPVSRVMAAVIKRWAKARDINNPARHTLSSYGYILMLLHFLTYHQRSGNGLVSPVGSSPQNRGVPLLPNLQWMDERWPQSPDGTPYMEFNDPPKVKMQHPFEESVKVNSYFYRPNAAMMNNLQRLFPGQDLSLAILLASFFRYYAYEFDYKRHVVSLNSTMSYGVVEREVKSELDGWRNYSAALTIEDPFETFYDVAHVLRGGYYHRIRREFAVAYTKIADVASGKTSGTWNNRTVDLTNMTGMALIDWICEPIVTGDKDEGSTTGAFESKNGTTA